MKEKLRRFFEGRYGIDELGIAIVILSMVFALAGNIAGSFWLQIPAYILLIWELIRYMSRKYAERRRENDFFRKHAGKLYEKLIKPIEKRFRLWGNMIRDRKTHRYFTCPKCHNALRVPKGRGEITITCPVCGEKLDRKT